MTKLFVFDYGRTLYDREKDAFFEDAEDVLIELSKRFRLAIVSYSKPDDVENRRFALRNEGFESLFEQILFANSPEGKDVAYLQLSRSMKVSPREMAIVDDYIVRGVAWGNRNGAITYWFKNGKFADSGPTNATGTPTYTIQCLSDILATPPCYSKSISNSDN